MSEPGDGADISPCDMVEYVAEGRVAEVMADLRGGGAGHSAGEAG